MPESPNSTNGSTNSNGQTELPADLSLDQDEVLDVELALLALGGIRHSAACDAAEKSTRRFDERNHRLHESRMKDLGMEGEEKESETDDMAHQVLIRSPIIHNHYDKTNQPQPAVQPQPQPQPTPAPTQKEGLGTLAKLAIAAAIGSGIAGTGVGLWALFQKKTGDTTIVNPITQADGTGIGLLPPTKPK